MGRTGVNGELSEAGASPYASLESEVAADLRGLLLAADVVLAAVAGPALVVSRNGQILRANASARRELACDAGAFRPSLVAALNEGTVGASPGGAAVGPRWCVTSLQTTSEPFGFLAILQGPTAPDRPLPAALCAASRRWKLTPRQEKVLELVGRGLTNELIAEALGIAKGTVEFHLSAIFDKAGVSNRATLIVHAMEVREQQEVSAAQNDRSSMPRRPR